MINTTDLGKQVSDNGELKLGGLVRISNKSRASLTEDVEKNLGKAPYQLVDRRGFGDPDMTMAYIQGKNGKTLEINLSHLEPYSRPQN